MTLVRTGSRSDREKTIVGVSLRGHPSSGTSILGRYRNLKPGVTTECHHYKSVFTQPL
jgi:hypothetical protein